MGELTDRIRANAAVAGFEVGAPTFKFDPSTIPQLDSLGWVPKAEDVEIDELIERLGIIEAYVRWCGKSEPQVGSKTESIMVSCPSPDHEDKKPSAWLNSDKDTFFCGGCQAGGNVFHIAGWGLGFDIDMRDKIRGEQFKELRLAIAEDLGYVVATTSTGREIVEALDAIPSQQVEPEEAPALALAPVIPIFHKDPKPQRLTVPWEEVCPEGTFLHSYVSECSKDKLPIDFHFWNALVAVGMASGHNAELADVSPVRGNLFVCHMGATGVGKSRSVRHLTNLLAKALPFDPADPVCTGTKLVAAPGSAEALIESFRKIVPDPTTNEPTVYGNVRGLVEIDELSTLSSLAMRVGNPMKPELIRLYDGGRMSRTTVSTGTRIAEEPFGSLVTTTQDWAIGKLLSREDAISGFLNRWVFALGEQDQPVSPLDDGGPNTVTGSRPDIDSLEAPLKALRQWTTSGREIRIAPEAATYFNGFFESTIRPILHDEESPELGQMSARVVLTLKKLVLLFAVNDKQEVASFDTIERALLVAEPLLASYRSVTYQMSRGDLKDALDTILDTALGLYQRNGDWPTKAEIFRKLPNRIEPRLRIEAMKHLLYTQAIVEESIAVPAGSRGKARTIDRYRVS